MKSSLTVARTEDLLIGRPPLFVIVCVLIWAAALVLAFLYPTASVDFLTVVSP